MPLSALPERKHGQIKKESMNIFEFKSEKESMNKAGQLTGHLKKVFRELVWVVRGIHCCRVCAAMSESHHPPLEFYTLVSTQNITPHYTRAQDTRVE